MIRSKIILASILVALLGALALAGGSSLDFKNWNLTGEFEANRIINNGADVALASDDYYRKNKAYPASVDDLVTEGYLKYVPDELVISVTAPYEGAAESIGFVDLDTCLIIHNLGTGSNDVSLVPDGDVDLTAPFDCIEDGAGLGVFIHR